LSENLELRIEDSPIEVKENST